MSELISKALVELQETLKRFEASLDTVEETGHLIVKALKNKNKILSCGNGGSASDALHLAEEFVGRYKGERRSLPAISLCADVTAITCIGNDYGYDEVFSRQVEGLGKPGDVLVSFTTSGNSTNVIKAIEVAKKMKLLTITLSGKDGGRALGLSDIDIVVPATDTARIQEVHTFILHQLLEIVENENWENV